MTTAKAAQARGEARVGRIAIIGAGASGTALAVQLLRRTRLDVMLVERGAFGRGLAYGTTCDAHLLNVRSGRMSLDPARPGDFVEWLAANSEGEADPEGFARRSTYGRYLQGRLAEAEAGAPGRLTRISGDVVEVDGRSRGVCIALMDGARVEADFAVLATGNLPPEPMRFAGAETLGEALIADPWAPGALPSIGRDEDVLMIGTGLTAVDVALALEARGWRGRGLMLSRRGLLPRSHDAVAAHPAPERPADGGALSAWSAGFRQGAGERGWGEAMDRMRPFVADLWRGLDARRRQRFLRHLRPWWDVHRHRTAVQVGATIRRMLDGGQLEAAAGRIVGAALEDERARVTWRPRGEADEASRPFDRIVVCTGPAFDLARTSDPLIGALFRSGAARADPLRLGLETDLDGRLIGVDGAPSDRLFAMGPLTRGAFWEIVAVPDIREQAVRLAELLGETMAEAGR